MAKKTTYQHMHDGKLFTRNSKRDYKFVVIHRGGSYASWHGTLKSAESYARTWNALRDFPVNRRTGERYTEDEYYALKRKGVRLRKDIIGYQEYVVAPINGGKEV